VSLNHWNESTRDELARILPDAVVVLPTGATEQHGPHLATGHDTFTVDHIANQAAGRAGVEHTIVLAPCLPFGSSDHHLPFGGTLSMSTGTYLHVVRDLVTSMITDGARRIFLLNGHGGNQELNQLVARDAVQAQATGSRVAIAAASYWEIAQQSLSSDPALEGFRKPGHAGQFETSTMLAMKASRVREPRPDRDDDPSLTTTIPGTRVELSHNWEAFDGFTDAPHKATAELGEIILDHVIRDVAAAFEALARIPLDDTRS